VEITGECQVEEIVAPTATDNCNGTLIGLTTTTFPITESTTVTWTYTDVAGNSTTQTQVVVIEDVTIPVPNLTALPDINVTCQLLELSSPVATDNCSGFITATTSTSLPITVSTDVIWTFTDDSGNSSSQLQRINVNDLNTEVTVEGINLTATLNNATYQWIDCNNNNALISGATSQSFTAVQDGDYAVEITLNGCTEVSDCIAVIVTGIAEEHLASMVNLYPNPARDVIMLDLQAFGASRLDLQLFSLDGLELFSRKDIVEKEIELDVSRFKQGTYLLKISSESTLVIKKVIIKR